MGLADKITDILMDKLQAEYVQVDNNDEISGLVVAEMFRSMSEYDRQCQIDKTMEVMLTKDENKKILMIVGLTPEEYSESASKIRIHEVKHSEDQIEVVLYGSDDDAKYVSDGLSKRLDLVSSKPEKVQYPFGRLMSFKLNNNGKGVETNKAIEALRQDRFVYVLPNKS